jgi:hypothetical protein
LALENYHIIDHNGNVLNKRMIFERHYSDTVDGSMFIEHNHPELSLIMAGMHSEYSLLPRTLNQDDQDETSEIIRGYLRSRAVVLARGLNVARKFDSTVAAMVEAMYDILENYQDVNRDIKEKALRRSQGSSR